MLHDHNELSWTTGTRSPNDAVPARGLCSGVCLEDCNVDSVERWPSATGNIKFSDEAVVPAIPLKSARYNCHSATRLLLLLLRHHYGYFVVLLLLLLKGENERL